MKIERVTVAVSHGEIYAIGGEINGIAIDDIIQNQDTKDIFCYDAGSNMLVAIRDGVPTVIEYVGAE